MKFVPLTVPSGFSSTSGKNSLMTSTAFSGLELPCTTFLSLSTPSCALNLRNKMQPPQLQVETFMNS